MHIRPVGLWQPFVPLELLESLAVSSLLVASKCQNVIKEINEGDHRSQHDMIINEIMAKKQVFFFQAMFSHKR
jgi:hypothetical protein